MVRKGSRTGFWAWLLAPFIVGVMTLSNIEGVSRIMVLYGLVLAGLYSVYFLYHRLSTQPEVIVYFLWIAWALTGVIVAGDQGLVARQLMTSAQMGILFFVVAGITSLRGEVSSVIAAIAIGALLLFVSSLASGEFFEAMSATTRTRAAGMSDNSNLFSYALLFVVIGVFHFWRYHHSDWWRALLTFMVLVALVGIIYAGSRSGIFSLIGFLIFWFVFCIEKRLPRNPVKLALIVLALLVAAFYAVDYVFSSTLIGKRLTILADDSSMARLDLYAKGFELIQRNVLFGVGLDNFKAYTGGLYSHSTYMEVAATTGLVGFILFHGVYLVLLLRLVRLRRLILDREMRFSLGLMMSSVLAILLHSAGDVKLTSKVTWIFVAALSGYSWKVEHVLKKLPFSIAGPSEGRKWKN